MDLHSINNNAISDPRILEKELRQIQAKGYALDIEKILKGVHCVVAPVINQDGKAIACIWITDPSGCLLLEEIDDKANQIIRTAGQISRIPGYKDEFSNQ